MTPSEQERAVLAIFRKASLALLKKIERRETPKWTIKQLRAAAVRLIKRQDYDLLWHGSCAGNTLRIESNELGRCRFTVIGKHLHHETPFSYTCEEVALRQLHSYVRILYTKAEVTALPLTRDTP